MRMNALETKQSVALPGFPKAQNEGNEAHFSLKLASKLFHIFGDMKEAERVEKVQETFNLTLNLFRQAYSQLEGIRPQSSF